MKKRRIAIFGPPGVGKSTLIRVALKRGIKSYDFEDFSSEERKKRAQKIFEEDFDGIVLFNSAGMQPSDFPSDVELVLLLPPKNVYSERMKERDELVPSKGGQDGFNDYNGFSQYKELFYRVIEDIATPDEILDKVINKDRF